MLSTKAPGTRSNRPISFTMADVQSIPQALNTNFFALGDLSPGSFAHQPISPPEQRKRSPAPAATTWEPPPSRWVPLCHPRVDEVSCEVDGYFLQHWNFPSSKAKKTFLMAGFSKVTSLYFPLAKDDRLHFACRLLTVLFLIDDVLEEMSLSDGEAYNAKLIPISRGDVLPNRNALQDHRVCCIR